MKILNVGFGTTKPRKSLHIVQSNVAIRLQDIYSSSEASTNIEFINGNNDIFSASTSNTDWRISNSNSMFSIQSGSNNIINNVINFTNSGYVGIGTNNPQQKLHIIGNIKLDGNIDASSYLIGNINLLTEIYDTSNYVVYTSNILATNANLYDTNSSNYVAFINTNLIYLITKTDVVANDTNSSNYVASTSNILVSKANLNDTNSSNYVV